MTAKPKTQIQKFREASREHEAAASEKNFDEKLTKIAKVKTQVEDRPQKKPGK